MASVKQIKKIGWKRKNLTQFKIFQNIIDLQLKKCPIINFNNMNDPNNPCLFCNIKDSGVFMRMS